MRRVGLALMLSGAAWCASAQPGSQEIMVCAAEENSVKRLACFDEMATKHSLAPSTTTSTGSPGTGEWHMQTDTDPLTDKAVYYAGLSASSGTGRFGDRVLLVVRCANNKTEMYINWASYLGSRSTNVTYRVGKEKAKTSSWSISSNHKATFYPGSPIQLIKELMDNDSFAANLTPYNENPITAVFNTSGAKEALADLRKGCNW